MTIKLQIETSNYNERRYGKPWIALVDFSGGAKGEFQFGEWCGQDGYAGTLYLDCEIGDVIAKGQKDNRKPRNSAPDYFIVMAGGELEECSKADAYKHFRDAASNPEDNRLAEFTVEELTAELVRRGVKIDRRFESTEELHKAGIPASIE